MQESISRPLTPRRKEPIIYTANYGDDESK